MAAKDELGKRGEQFAADYLGGKGFTVIDRNWRCPTGEIDLIATADGELVFIEVKTRSSVAYGHPFEAITVHKLARLRKLAGAWCEAHPETRSPIRIDVVGVIAPSGGEVEIEHLERVF